MADDRYAWLDEEAAERLLRGRPGDRPEMPRDGEGAVPDGVSGAGNAQRLAELLGELIPSCPESAEMPGEAAALTAFRETREGRAQTAPVAGGGALGTSVPDIGRRALRRTGRPLRAGFAVALAGCALGGVAVAATTGALTAPFDPPTREPGRSTTAPPLVSEDDGSAPGERDSQDSRGPAGGAPRTGSHDDPASGRPGAGGEDAVDGRGGDADLSWSLDWLLPTLPRTERDRAMVAHLCRAYERELIQTAERRQLAEAAGGSEHISRFCGSRGDGDDGDGRADGGGDGGNGGENDSGSPGSGEDSGRDLPTGPTFPAGGDGDGGLEGGDEVPGGGLEGGDEVPGGGLEGGDEVIDPPGNPQGPNPGPPNAPGNGDPAPGNGDPAPGNGDPAPHNPTPGGPGTGGGPGNGDGGPGDTPGSPGSKPGHPNRGNPGSPGSKPGSPNPGNPAPGSSGGKPGSDHGGEPGSGGGDHPGAASGPEADGVPVIPAQPGPATPATSATEDRSGTARTPA
ncbi:hypothetical protein [Streptomyces sp. JJ38]|uniref:hypothetical protein n=1 Tax=Streptomyces sp. JJ38 TaxID=2738128 RepID=UPI001C5A2E8C|nr:hypothetical protein [Streptomyces sp. JJ38]MBW1596666.1 hypothetical protein [Streptomyces sp. JJ38]